MDAWITLAFKNTLGFLSPSMVPVFGRLEIWVLLVANLHLVARAKSGRGATSAFEGSLQTRKHI